MIVVFDDILYPKVVTKEYIVAAIEDEDSLSVEHVDDKGILVWDDQDVKQIYFRFMERFGPGDLVDLITVSEDVPDEYHVDKDVLAEYLWAVCDRNAFITMEELVIIWSESDDEETFEPADFEDSEARRLCDELGDEYALEIGQGVLGQLWFERNIAIVNMGEIVRTAQEVARENDDLGDPYFSFENQVEVGFLTTVLHELRHLQMDTNIILPEEDYPLEWSSETNVEEYCRVAFESSGVPSRLFPNLWSLSLDDTLDHAIVSARQCLREDRKQGSVDRCYVGE